MNYPRMMLACATLMLAPALMQAQGRSGAAKPKVVATRGANRRAAVAFEFRDPDRTAVRDYFRTAHLEVAELPPGIAKKVARGKPLPPGIAKKVFPRSVIRRQGLDADIVFIMVGHDMLAVRKGVVVDIMINVFP